MLSNGSRATADNTWFDLPGHQQVSAGGMKREGRERERERGRGRATEREERVRERRKMRGDEGETKNEEREIRRRRGLTHFAGWYAGRCAGVPLGALLDPIARRLCWIPQRQGTDWRQRTSRFATGISLSPSVPLLPPSPLLPFLLSSSSFHLSRPAS